jgi:LmbE family N-acetylglucosaminyl deacetylase
MTGALIASGLGAAAITWLRASCDRRFISYDVARDQHYEFTGSDAATFEVAVDRTGFLWPQTSEFWDTAILSLAIEHTLSGRIADPRIETRADGRMTRQYLERGARGLRLLNLSGLRGDGMRAGEPVSLSGCHVTWAPQNAQLHLFKTPLPERPRVLVLAPHPDDAEIAAFGRYARSDAFVVTITAGDHAGFYLDRARRSETATASVARHARVWDSLTVPFFGGVPPERCVNLGYVDSSLTEMFENRASAGSNGTHSIAESRRVNLSSLTPPAPATTCWAGLVSDLTHVIKEIRPEVIVTPHPLLDDHPDHAFTTLAVCEALAAASPVQGQLLLYVNHSPSSSLYPCGRSDGAVPPPPHFGSPAPFRSILSEPLSRHAQELKFLALEAMHDLRTLPDEDPPSWIRLLRSGLSELRGKVTGRGRMPTSYFRRAVRPNELFFGMPFSDSPRLVDHFMAEWQAGRIRWHVCP